MCIADWLIAHNHDDYMNAYAKVRATVIMRSLTQLREQQKAHSGGSTQGLNATSSPMLVCDATFILEVIHNLV